MSSILLVSFQGKFCGKRNPGSLRTSGTSALVYFHSDFSKGSTGFEVMYESSRDEGNSFNHS